MGAGNLVLIIRNQIRSADDVRVMIGTRMRCVCTRGLITEKLQSYGAARNEPMPTSLHCDQPYANNRCEVSHEHMWQQGMQLWCCKSLGHAQLVLAVHGHCERKIKPVSAGLCLHRLFQMLAIQLRQQRLQKLLTFQPCLDAHALNVLPTTVALVNLLESLRGNSSKCGYTSIYNGQEYGVSKDAL